MGYHWKIPWLPAWNYLHSSSRQQPPSDTHSPPPNRMPLATRWLGSHLVHLLVWYQISCPESRIKLVEKATWGVDWWQLLWRGERTDLWVYFTPPGRCGCGRGYAIVPLYTWVTRYSSRYYSSCIWRGGLLYGAFHGSQTEWRWVSQTTVSRPRHQEYREVDSVGRTSTCPSEVWSKYKPDWNLTWFDLEQLWTCGK